MLLLIVNVLTFHVGVVWQKKCYVNKCCFWLFCIFTFQYSTLCCKHNTRWHVDFDCMCVDISV